MTTLTRSSAAMPVYRPEPETIGAVECAAILGMECGQHLYDVAGRRSIRYTGPHPSKGSVQRFGRFAQADVLRAARVLALELDLLPPVNAPLRRSAAPPEMAAFVAANYGTTVVPVANCTWLEPAPRHEPLPAEVDWIPLSHALPATDPVSPATFQALGCRLRSTAHGYTERGEVHAYDVYRLCGLEPGADNHTVRGRLAAYRQAMQDAAATVAAQDRAAGAPGAADIAARREEIFAAFEDARQTFHLALAALASRS